MKLTFWGADKTVTGSMHHVETGSRQYLLDCGLYQGRRQEAFERNSQFPFAASAIDAVILSHAHIDHSGNLPGLVKHGFQGPIYATPATVDLCLAMLADSAFLQEKDAEFVNRRREHRKAIGRDDRPVAPLYTQEDAEANLPAVPRRTSWRKKADCRRPFLHDLRCGTHPGFHFHDCGGRRRAPGLFGRRGPARVAHHTRSPKPRPSRLSDPRKHLRRPPPQAAGPCSRHARGRGQPHGCPRRQDHRARVRGGPHPATGLAAA